MNTKAERINKAVAYLKGEQIIKFQKDIMDAMKADKNTVSQALLGNDKYLTDSFIARFAEVFPDINADWLLTGKGNMLKTNNPDTPDCRGDVILIPLLPLAAQGGSLNDFIVSVKSDDCEKIVSPIRGVDFAMTVSGDSMDPEYPSGSKILIKKINEKAFIEWGRVYVLDTCNGSVIKKILPGSTPEAVSCVSINAHYPPFQVAFDDVYGMYRVLMLLSEK